ncbi:hypothetical protein BC936DRAFT_139819 [Jimgerdemannia flammicorona]|uniref:Uncharacterized protein n=1 Tax=Jimgerdemannia flammicorona TaxID=994334 RepID=A0A433B951_9FUNG|nr:hypothetical protein BC936DRAFT_139819 [Jimgerdemannia flammicorona]
MKKQIEHDQRNREYTYQLFHGNCTRYAKSIAEIAGIDLPASIPLIKLFIRNEQIHEVMRRFLNSKFTPAWVRPFLVRSWAVCFNTFGLLWGSGIVDKEVKEDPIYHNVQPYIKDIYDLTDPEKVITHHPYIIGHFVRKDIERWRAEQTEPLRVQHDRLADRLKDLSRTVAKASTEAVVELEKERVKLTEKMEEFETQIDNLKYTCPPHYLKRPGTTDLKDNPWVGKTRITDDSLLDDDHSTTDTDDVSSTGTFDRPPFAPARKKSVVPADIMVIKESDGHMRYVEIGAANSPVNTPDASAVSSPVMSGDGSWPPTPTMEGVERFELPLAVLGPKVKGVFVGDSVEEDKLLLEKGLEGVV